MTLNPHISETQWVWITTYQNHKSDFHSLWSESLLARAHQSLPHLSKRKHKYVFESCVRNCNCWWHHCKLTSLQAKCCKEQRVFTAWRIFGEKVIAFHAISQAISFQAISQAISFQAISQAISNKAISQAISFQAISQAIRSTSVMAQSIPGNGTGTSIFQPVHSLMQIQVHCDLLNMLGHHTSPITLMMDPGQGLRFNDVEIRAVYHKAVTGFCIRIWIRIQWRPPWKWQVCHWLH